MVTPETLMRQAGMTAETWMCEANRMADTLEITDETAKAKLIAAYMIAAALDQLTMTYRDVEEARTGAYIYVEEAKTKAYREVEEEKLS